ncbi:hypothetical protein Q4503_17020 [Colwellia sp. 6_MG-2023]|uniref:hypothetical protein n=1 Tax=Colwellia sp. 6_MG-2023 TaxID=3062676 RepID=UPI0026E15B73|nr:hypothetical protein [Colwellia sp. 6_MG-2023]MDO6489399.1 hypothetical protein [Colwellia sp. 6_MG-2023]
MRDNKHKTRLELIRNNKVINTIEPNMESGNDVLEMSTSSSIDSFPIFSFKSTSPELNSVFITYSKNDQIRLSIAQNGEDEYMKMFEGEFFKKETNSTSKPDCLSLKIESIHSFFRLSLLEISSVQEFKNITFDAFVKKLMDFSGINIEINISPDIAILPVTGISRHTNLFRLFKEVCLMIDATVVFNKNNTIDIESRKSKINGIRKQEVINLTNKDIISIESTEQI